MLRCLNCNKETTGTQVFCEECLQAMEGYPVQKGTPVTIPVQPSPTATKKQLPTRWHAVEEDKLAAAQRTNRWLALALIVMSLLLTLSAVVLIYITTSNGGASLFARTLSGALQIGCFT